MSSSAMIQMAVSSDNVFNMLKMVSGDIGQEYSLRANFDIHCILHADTSESIVLFLCETYIAL